MLGSEGKDRGAGASARARDEARARRWCGQIGAIAERACIHARLDIGKSARERAVLLGALARKAIGDDAARFARENTGGAITAKVRVEKTLDKAPAARAWLAGRVEQAVSAMGGHAIIDEARAMLRDIAGTPAAEVAMGRSRVLVEVGPAARVRLARAPGWVARSACATLGGDALERANAEAWARALIERAARRKIAGAQDARCTAASAREALEWPLPECVPPLAALWADSVAGGADAARWGARIETEARTGAGECTGEEWERRVRESATGYRARLRERIASKANERMTQQAKEHWEARARGRAERGRADDTVPGDAGAWAPSAGRAGAQGLREAWRREKALGQGSAPQPVLAPEPDTGRKGPRAGWWLDYRSANAFMAASEGRLAPWEIAKNEGAWVGAGDPQWEEPLKRRARADHDAGSAAARALARAMREIRQRWDETLR